MNSPRRYADLDRRRAELELRFWAARQTLLLALLAITILGTALQIISGDDVSPLRLLTPA